jgi:hypothetical protein
MYLVLRQPAVTNVTTREQGSAAMARMLVQDSRAFYVKVPPIRLVEEPMPVKMPILAWLMKGVMENKRAMLPTLAQW